MVAVVDEPVGPTRAPVRGGLEGHRGLAPTRDHHYRVGMAHLFGASALDVGVLDDPLAFFAFDVAAANEE